MRITYTPEKITELAKNEIFVFGSNPAGFHVGGAAKTAMSKFGAIYGQPDGLQGQSYGITCVLPTTDMIRPHVDTFIKFAKKHPELTFLVTQIGCANAGYTPYDIAPLFEDAYELKNVILPESFVFVIERQPRFIGNPLNSWDHNKDFLDLKKRIEKSILPNPDAIRDIYIRTFHNTVQIVNSGFYITKEGKTIQLPDSVRMEKRTVLYETELSADNVPCLKEKTIIEIVEKDCLKEAVRLTQEGLCPAVLNMANRQRPGGGVLTGSRAQEESIFRRTNIFRSLFRFASFAGNFGIDISGYQYPLNRDFGGIYSPDVLIFRDSEKYGCRLLENPEYTSVISVAAMNRPTIDPSGRIAKDLIGGVKNKIRTIFRIGLRHRHDSLVLGAWGCGAFRNPPEHIAALFHEVLNEKEFKNKFKKIVFAIMEDHNSRKAHNPEGNLIPFRKEFSN